MNTHYHASAIAVRPSGTYNRQPSRRSKRAILAGAVLVSGLIASSAAGGEIICHEGGDCDHGGPDGSGGATIAYSIDLNSDSLVSINTDTGETMVIGAIGHDMSDTDLAVHDGRLFALNTRFGQYVQLLEIDLTTGAALSVSNVQLDAGGILHAEGLAADDSGLILAYAVGANASSTQLGALGFDGTISSPFNLAQSFSGVDIDGLGRNPFTGELVSGDVGAQMQFYSLGAGGGAYDVFASHEIATVTANDVAFLSTSMIGIDDYNGMLHHFDLDTGELLMSVATADGMKLAGLAVIPGPGVLSLLLIAGAGGGRRRRCG